MKRLVFIGFSVLFIISCSLPMYNEELIKTLASIESLSMDKLGETVMFGVDWDTEPKELFFYPVRDEESITYGLAVVKRKDSNIDIKMLGPYPRYVEGFNVEPNYADNFELVMGEYYDGSTTADVMYIESNSSNVNGRVFTLNFNNMEPFSSSSSSSSSLAVSFSYIAPDEVVAGFMDTTTTTEEHYSYFSSISSFSVSSASYRSGSVISNAANIHYELAYDSDLTTNPTVGYISYEQNNKIMLTVATGTGTGTGIYTDMGEVPGHVVDISLSGRVVLYNPDKKMFYLYKDTSMSQKAVEIDGSLINYCGEYEIGTRKKLVFSLATVFETKNGKAANFTLYAYEP